MPLLLWMYPGFTYEFLIKKIASFLHLQYTKPSKCMVYFTCDIEGVTMDPVCHEYTLQGGSDYEDSDFSEELPNE